MSDHTEPFWRYSNKDGETGFGWLCPGCGTNHAIPVTGPRAWGWDGNEEKPTFKPSVRVQFTDWAELRKVMAEQTKDGEGVDPDVYAELVKKHPPKKMNCHFFIRAGVAEFCNDSTHEHAGAKLPVLPERGS